MNHYHTLFLFTLLLILSACQHDAENVAMGTLERDRILLSSPSSETITHVWVLEGQTVQAGTPLIQLDDRKSRALLAQRQAELDKAQVALDELISGTRSEQVESAQAELLAAKAQRHLAKIDHQRNIELYSKNTIGKAEVDLSKSQLDAASANVSAQQAKVNELINGARQQDIQQAQKQVASAAAALAWQQTSLDELTIIAPQAGTIDSLPWHEGERVNTGTQLISLLSESRIYARVYLPAKAISKIIVGSAVEVAVDGVTSPLSGTVATIRSTPAFTPFYALNERDRDRLVYLTEIDISDARSLSTGIGLEVHIP